MSEPETGRVASQPGSREPSPDGLGPTGFDPSRDEAQLEAYGSTLASKQLSAIIRGWLNADDATHWGAFETTLHAAVSGTVYERAAIVAMLRSDARAMRANAFAYSEEAPTDAAALHEVASTLTFKAAQIERGDHLYAVSHGGTQ